MRSRGNYYPPAHESDDDDYLEGLVAVVRGALMRLPSQAAISRVSAHAAKRCAEAQVHAHATAVLGDAQLEGWAITNAIGTGLQWREFLAGAVSSALALHALIATSGDVRACSRRR